MNRAAHDATDRWLVAGGEMGDFVRAKDWSQSPLGPLESWSPPLRSVASLVLGSSFPMAVVWGEKATLIYNDAYRAFLGDKHPQSVGRAFAECWEASFSVVGPAFRKALGGTAAFVEDQRMFLDRHGYLEEAFFTYTFDPVRDETGAIAGLLHPIIEATPKVLAQRRMRALRDLADDAGEAQSIDECLVLSAKSLAQSDLDLPFLLLYALDDDEAKSARLVAHAGLAPGHSASPPLVDLTQPTGWPFAHARTTGRPVAVADVQARFPGLRCGPYPELVRQAYVLPIHLPGRRSLVFAVAGASQRLPLNEVYVSFYGLLASGLAKVVANVAAIETERRRAEALDEIDHAKTAFFSNVSHEFRTPLTLMLGPIEDELAENDHPLPPGRRARLQVAHRNSLRLLRMVDTLLDFSHIEAGRMQASFEPVDLAAITEDLANHFRGPIEKAGLRLSTRLESLPEPVHVDREMWAKIVLNLLSNAFKHTFKGGITVSLFASDESKDHVELRVDDTGTGIGAKDLPRLFQRFHKVKGARSRSDDGTGIGLALVRALAALHGGEVGVSSREGLGSSFRVRLRRGSSHLPKEQVVPAVRSAASHDAHVGPFVEEALRWSKGADGVSETRNMDIVEADKSGEAPAVRARVLLADSNPDMRSYVGRLLRRSYDVEAVADGEAALQAALATPPDIVVLDVMLPGRDGLQLVKELRAVERTCLIPVILLSARAGEDSALEGLDAGADDYLVKPFSGKALLARVRACLALAKLRKEYSDKLTEANKELEAFSYSVSHDLRAPLRAIDGFSKALLSDHAESLDEQGRRYLERVRSSTQRMAQLIDDLLSLSRITRAPLTRDRVDLTAIGRRIVSDLSARDPDRKVEVIVADGLVGNGDARLVMVMLENLLGNAWKFTGKQPDARITVGSEAQNGTSVFFIRDNGAGFNMEYANKLFAPFQRLHSASEFQGTGIGLATVHRVVSRHGGRIWAESSPNRGATFFFTLGDPT